MREDLTGYFTSRLTALAPQATTEPEIGAVVHWVVPDQLFAALRQASASRPQALPTPTHLGPNDAFVSFALEAGRSRAWS